MGEEFFASRGAIYELLRAPAIDGRVYIYIYIYIYIYNLGMCVCVCVRTVAKRRNGMKQYIGI